LAGYLPDITSTLPFGFPTSSIRSVPTVLTVYILTFASALSRNLWRIVIIRRLNDW
jgi:hypothetical protein